MEETSRLKKYTKAILYSLIGAPLITLLSCIPCAEDLKTFIGIAIISTAMWVVMWIGNAEIAHLVSLRISWVEFPVKRFIVGVITTIGFTVSVTLVLLKVWEYIMDIQFKTYYNFVLASLIITFLITFFIHGREFLLQWRQSAVDAERFQKESVAANYENLKNQVNPHFLFNSLNILTSLIYKDPDKAALFVKKMSEVYRYVLDTRDREIVDLNDELAFTESYLHLQKIRFGDNLRIKNQISGQSGKVVPLAIQMLVENAIKHNEISAEHPLEIHLKQTDNYILVNNRIQIKNSSVEKHSGIGLENIKSRYKYLSNLEVRFGKTGNNFEVKIPLIQSDHS